MTLSPLAGNGTEGTFTPDLVYAGESDIITQAETFAQGFNVLQYTVLGRRADGKVVPLDIGGDSSTAKPAVGAADFTGGLPTNSQTFTVNSHAITFVTTGAAGAQVNLGTAAQMAEDTAALINAAPGTYLMHADAENGIVDLTATTAGTGGNSLTLAKSGTYPAISGATLSEGSAGVPEKLPEGRVVGVAMQAVNALAADVMGPIAVTAVFNANRLVWPSGITTLVVQRALCEPGGIRLNVPK